MEFDRDLLKSALKNGCDAFEIELNGSQVEDFCRYAEILVEWNQKMNLTAITEPAAVAVKHFTDSLLFTKAFELSGNERIIDVGTGAGFPGIPLKIYKSGIELTLLDSLNKRMNFLKEVSEQLNQDNECIHARAEEQGRKKESREQYDIATARAVAHLRELSEYCLPFVKVGGFFVSLKGYDIENELDEAKKAIELLGGKIERVEKFILPDESRRSIVIVKKISQTAPKYPRQSAKIAKSPIK